MRVRLWSGSFQNPFGFHFSSRKQWAQLLHAARGVAKHFGHDRFSDFHHVAVAICADGRAARFAGEQRHFAKTIAGSQFCNLDVRSVFRQTNVRCSSQHHEHRIARGALLDDRFATPEKFEARLPNHMIELFFGKTFEKSFPAQNRKRLGLVFLGRAPGLRWTCNVRIGKGMVMPWRLSSYQTLVRTESLISLIRK